MYQCFIPSVSIVNLNNSTGKERTSSEHTQYPGPIDQLLPFFIYYAGDELGGNCGGVDIVEMHLMQGFSIQYSMLGALEYVPLLVVFSFHESPVFASRGLGDDHLQFAPMVEFGFLASCLTTHHGSIPLFYPFACPFTDGVEILRLLRKRSNKKTFQVGCSGQKLVS
jgi:hypothetical protein